MGRILAIDYGSRKVGLAVTDPEQIIANGLTTVEERELMDYLRNYTNKEEVECIVVGYPKNLYNEGADFMPYVKEFLTKLQTEFPEMPIEKMDERFTSKMAIQSMQRTGLKKKKQQDEKLVDEISATIILQSYMERASKT